jgi:glycosyltransferase involved in cell wall biosynthesis
MIILCEPLRWDQEHVPVNNSFLEAVRLAFPDEEVQVYGEEKHLGHLSTGSKDDRFAGIKFLPVKRPTRHETLRKRLLQDYGLTKVILDRFQTGNRNLLIFTSLTMACLWTLRLQRNRLKGIDVWVIYHAGLQTLVGWRPRNPLKRILGLETGLRIACKGGVQLIVLEQPILDTVERKMPELSGCVHLVEHPIPPGLFETVPVQHKIPLQFGFLGLGTKQKGIVTFVDVASATKENYPKKADFHVVGRLHPDMDSEKLPGIDSLTTKPFESRLKRDRYEKLVRQLHYVCLFFEGKHYDVTASGVLLDCIGREKPIVTSNIVLFQKLEERYGDIGHICTDGRYDRLIAELIENPDPERYRRQVENLRNAKRARSPAQLALNLQALRR